MMPRKKRHAFIIAIIIIIILIVVAGLAILYLNTDLFKSNQSLFTKYIEKNMENLEKIETIGQNAQYDNLLKNSKYTEQSEIKVTYTENKETTSENRNNIINKLKVSIDGQTDKANQYDYKEIKLLKEDNPVLNIETIQNQNTYGIKLADLFKQYILVENSNLKDLCKKIGYAEEQISNIPDKIEVTGEIFENIKLSEEEKENLKNQYLNIIIQNVTKENFQKQTNQVININGKDITTNAYMLSLTKEKMNDIYIEILENLKQDTIVLGKIDYMQSVLDKMGFLQNGNIYNVKEELVKEIDKTIEEITKNNIGNEEINIIVYENSGETVRTSIKGPEYEINFDFSIKDNEKYCKIRIEEKDETREYQINESTDEINFSGKEEKEDKIKNISFKQSKKINNKNCLKNTNIKYEDSNNQIEANITQNLDFVDEIEKEIVLDNQNSVKLNNMEEEQLKQVIDRIDEGINQKIQSLNEEINQEELKKILKNIGILQDTDILNITEISETEKNRFNSKFEILQGEEISSDNVVNTIETIKDNLINMQVVSNKELKLEINQKQNNEELATTLKNFVEKDKGRKYNIKVEYDEIGLVKYIVLTIVEKK